ncbi:hypothetical protein SCB49_00495 [unidentified eubacterium SCB49]|nr:hypothetical protein SCB49_00495 [unidentified eubacterium SCB49]
MSQEEKMKWDESRLLTWKDFRGTPDKSTDYVASTHSGISLSFGSKTENGKVSYTIEVGSYFYPEKSWYRPGNISAYILKHEQTHFDISEVYARKLRKKIAELDQTAPDFKEKVAQVYSENEYERTIFQADFDIETGHSNFPEFEREWEQKVADLLIELNDWK